MHICHEKKTTTTMSHQTALQTDRNWFCPSGVSFFSRLFWSSHLCLLGGGGRGSSVSVLRLSCLVLLCLLRYRHRDRRQRRTMAWVYVPIFFFPPNIPPRIFVVPSEISTLFMRNSLFTSSLVLSCHDTHCVFCFALVSWKSSSACFIENRKN